jgi:hypothetical protein
MGANLKHNATPAQGKLKAAVFIIARPPVPRELALGRSHYRNAITHDGLVFCDMARVGAAAAAALPLAQAMGRCSGMQSHARAAAVKHGRHGGAFWVSCAGGGGCSSPRFVLCLRASFLTPVASFPPPPSPRRPPSHGVFFFLVKLQFSRCPCPGCRLAVQKEVCIVNRN